MKASVCKGFGYFCRWMSMLPKEVDNVICNQKVVGSIPIAGTSFPASLVRRKNFLPFRRGLFIVLFLRRGVEQSGSSSGS